MNAIELGRRQLFFYWRLAPEQLDAATHALRGWHGHLAVRHTGLQARLYRRGETGATTLMETYAMPAAAGIDEALAAVLQLEGDRLTQPWRQGERHLEAFDQL